MEKFMGLWAGLTIIIGLLAVSLEASWSLWFNVGLSMIVIALIALAYCGINATATLWFNIMHKLHMPA